jgi:hypothetical protein
MPGAARVTEGAVELDRIVPPTLLDKAISLDHYNEELYRKAMRGALSVRERPGHCYEEEPLEDRPTAARRVREA